MISGDESSYRVDNDLYRVYQSNSIKYIEVDGSSNSIRVAIKWFEPAQTYDVSTQKCCSSHMHAAIAKHRDIEVEHRLFYTPDMWVLFALVLLKLHSISLFLLLSSLSLSLSSKCYNPISETQYSLQYGTAISIFPTLFHLLRWIFHTFRNMSDTSNFDIS